MQLIQSIKLSSNPTSSLPAMDMTKADLPNKTYQTKPTKPNLPNQTYQTKLTNPKFPKEKVQTCPQPKLVKVNNQYPSDIMHLKGETNPKRKLQITQLRKSFL